MRKPITFASMKGYCLITLICPIVLISHIAQLLLTVSFIVSVKVCIFPLNMRYIIINVARWWEKYLSKRSPLKHTCSGHDKLIVLWTLNRQAKNIFTYLIVKLSILAVPQDRSPKKSYIVGETISFRLGCISGTRWHSSCLVTFTFLVHFHNSSFLFFSFFLTECDMVLHED